MVWYFRKHSGRCKATLHSVHSNFVSLSIMFSCDIIVILIRAALMVTKCHYTGIFYFDAPFRFLRWSNKHTLVICLIEHQLLLWRYQFLMSSKGYCFERILFLVSVLNISRPTFAVFWDHALIAITNAYWLNKLVWSRIKLVFIIHALLTHSRVFNVFFP